MKAHPALLALPLLLASGAALATAGAMPEQGIVQCRALGDGGARLACYDAIKVGAGVTAGTQVAAPVAGHPARSREDSFGMEMTKMREEQPQSITSTVRGSFAGWGPGSQIHLANGQVWRITDGSEAVLSPAIDRKVTIERNVFGTLFLKVDGSNNSAKVRRVK